MNSVTTMSGTIAAVNPRTTPAAAHRTPPRRALHEGGHGQRQQDQQHQRTDEGPDVDRGHGSLACDDAQQHGQHDQLDEHEQRSRRQQPLGRPARERGERDDVVHARGQQHEEHAHEERVVVGHEPAQPEHHRRHRHEVQDQQCRQEPAVPQARAQRGERHRQERRQQEQREYRLDEHRPRAGPGHGPPDDGARGDPREVQRHLVAFERGGQGAAGR